MEFSIPWLKVLAPGQISSLSSFNEMYQNRLLGGEPLI